MDRHLDRGRRTLTTNRLPRPVVAGLVVVPVGFLALFYLWPFATLLSRGLRVDAIDETLGDDRTWEVLWFTTWQASLSTVLTLVVGLAPAYVLARYRFPGRAVVASALTSVFVLPTVVVGAAVSALLPDGWDRGVTAILVAHVIFNVAVVVRIVGSVWEQLPRDLEQAAATLGASPLTVLRRVTLPLLGPSIAAAAAIVFVFTFTSFGVIRVLGSTAQATVEVEIWRQATQLGEIGPAAVLTLVQLAVLLVVVAWSARTRRRSALGLRPRQRPRRPATARERLTVTGVVTMTSLLIAAPLAALVIRSLRVSGRWTLAGWTDLGAQEVRPGIRLGIDPVGAIVRSLQAAAWATAIAVVIGALAVLAIDATGRTGRWLDAGVMLPLGTSAVTIGFGMLITFDVAPVDWRGSWWIVPVGHALVAVPFVVRSSLGVVRGIDPRLREAALTLGATPTRAWWSVVLPHLRRPLLVGAGLAAAISLGEFGATSFLSRSGGDTMPLAIERLLGRTGGVLQAQGYALATILALVTVSVVLAVDRSGRELLGRDPAGRP